jgi:hypothetical protein
MLGEYDKKPSCETAQKGIIGDIENKCLEGIRIRSRVKWYEGEKSSKYFLENYKGKNKTVSSIKKKDGTVTSKIEEILDTQFEFY